MNATRQLEDPQLELIFLRSCIGVSKLYFSLRTCPPHGFLDVEELCDAAMREFLHHIITEGNKGFGEIKFREATMPIKYGGLGTLTVHDTKQFAYVAYFIQSMELQQRILKEVEISKGVDFNSASEVLQGVLGESEVLCLALEDYVPPRKLMKLLAESFFKEIAENIATEYSMIPIQKAVFKCLQDNHAQEFLYTLPISGRGQTMTAREYMSVLCYRLMVPMFLEDLNCPGCNKFGMHAYGDHAVHCRSDPGIKHRHDVVRDGLADILRRVGVAPRKEAPITLTKEGSDKLLRHADVLIYNWSQDRHSCVDLSGCSPLVGIEGGGL